MSTAASARPRLRPVWLTAVVVGGFGLFYAFLVWSAVDLLIRQATGPLGLSGLGVFVHVLPIAFPILAFAVAFALGWRRSTGAFALILLTGLALSAVFWVNILSYAVTSYALYGG